MRLRKACPAVVLGLSLDPSVVLQAAALCETLAEQCPNLTAVTLVHYPFPAAALTAATSEMDNDNDGEEGNTSKLACASLEKMLAEWSADDAPRESPLRRLRHELAQCPLRIDSKGVDDGDDENPTSEPKLDRRQSSPVLRLTPQGGMQAEHEQSVEVDTHRSVVKCYGLPQSEATAAADTGVMKSHNFKFVFGVADSRRFVAGLDTFRDEDDDTSDGDDDDDSDSDNGKRHKMEKAEEKKKQKDQGVIPTLLVERSASNILLLFGGEEETSTTDDQRQQRQEQLRQAVTALNSTISERLTAEKRQRQQQPSLSREDSMDSPMAQSQQSSGTFGGSLSGSRSRSFNALCSTPGAADTIAKTLFEETFVRQCRAAIARACAAAVPSSPPRQDDRAEDDHAEQAQATTHEGKEQNVAPPSVATQQEGKAKAPEASVLSSSSSSSSSPSRRSIVIASVCVCGALAAASVRFFSFGSKWK